MATGVRTDPYRGFNFMVEIDGITQAGFQECGGLDSSTDPVDYREGTDPNHVRKLTGLNKFSPITLKRGITDSAELWKWRQTVADGNGSQRIMSGRSTNSSKNRPSSEIAIESERPRR